MTNATTSPPILTRLQAAIEDDALPQELRDLLRDAKLALEVSQHQTELLLLTQMNQASVKSSYEDAYFNLLASS